MRIAETGTRTVAAGTCLPSRRHVCQSWNWASFPYSFKQNKKRRVDDYIHLRDVVASDATVEDIGKMFILPATFTGSPRHMHEYAQDAMTYVRNCGRPDLFKTFTCNSAWAEIKEELLVGQSPADRHDLTARFSIPFSFFFESRATPGISASLQ
jgi:hypothetical protein